MPKQIIYPTDDAEKQLADRWNDEVDSYAEMLRTVQNHAYTIGYQQPRQWIPLDDSCPRNGTHVLIGGYNKHGQWRTYHGYYIQPRTIEADDAWDVYANDEAWAQYDEETDTYYCPEGWYSLDWANMDDTYMITDHPITHYILIPSPPAQ